MVKIDPTLPWDTLLNRVLQSWRDRAPRYSQYASLRNSLVCGRCRQDKYINLAVNSDPGITEEWPHWMQHSLQENLADLRTSLLLPVFERPHFYETIGDYYRGSALVKRNELTEPIVRAREIVHDHSKVVDIWLQQRMAEIHPWPTRVRKSATRHVSTANVFY